VSALPDPKREHQKGRGTRLVEKKATNLETKTSTRLAVSILGEVEAGFYVELAQTTEEEKSAPGGC